MRTHWIVLTFLLALLGAANAHAQQPRPESVNDYLQRCEAFGWSGVVLVFRDGNVEYSRGIGLADRAAGIANEPDTLFEIASITKVLTACAVMKLVEMGEITLDDSIAQHLPGVPIEKHGITVRHLLSHTSGMPRYGSGGTGDDLERAVAAYLSTPFAANPGEQSEYWNGGYALLAGIIERVSGQSYQSFCREHIFAPAGMESTGFTGDDFDGAPVAAGYNGSVAARTAAEHPYGSYGWHYKGMGGVVTSANDLARFVAAYESGKLLNAETVQQMEAPGVGTYGLGWGLSTTDRGTRRIGHGGAVSGFHSYLLRFPDEGTLIVVLSNTDVAPVWKIAWNIESLVFDQPLRTPSPPVVAEAPDLSALAGAYESAEGDRIVIRKQGASLSVGAIGDEAMRALEPATANARASAAVTQARAILNAVIESRPSEIASQLGPGIPGNWPRRLCADIWPEHEQAHGAFIRAEPRGARMIGPGSHEVLFALEHEGEPANLRVVITRGKLQIFDLNGPEFLIDVPMAVLQDGSLARFDWMNDAVSAQLRVQRTDGDIALVAEHDGVKPAGFKRIETD